MTTTAQQEVRSSTSSVVEDDPYFKAAKAICEADFLFFATGAGWSADSGLLVYKDVANVSVYKSLNLNYQKLANATSMTEHPDLFYGFWCNSANVYRNTTPHDGYAILQKWKKLLFSSPHEHFSIRNEQDLHTTLKSVTSKTSTLRGAISSPEANEKHAEMLALIEKEMNGSNETTVLSKEKLELLAKKKQIEKKKLYDDFFVSQITRWQSKYFPTFFLRAETEIGLPGVDNIPGPFFCYTSNVDGHFHKYFKRQEIEEIHGSIEYWQCAKKCKTKVWPLPASKRFKVTEDLRVVREDNEQAPKPVSSELFPGFKYDPFESSNVPTCPYCGGNARPNILLFSDSMYFDTPFSDINMDIWKSNVGKLLQKHNSKLVILEIGAGTTVATVRYQTNSMFKSIGDKHASFIRINMDAPYFKNHYFNTKAAQEDCPPGFIPIRDRGLNALRKIDTYIDQILTTREHNHL